MSIEIKYKDSTIANLKNGETATIPCSGKKLTGDLTIIAPDSSSGECDGDHIIEVAELPTENIDENVLYKVGDSYYKHSVGELRDIIVCILGSTISFVEQYTSQGLSFELYYVKTRPTENIVVSSPGTFACYYIDDEDDILVYGDLDENGTNEWASLIAEMGYPYHGAITDASEAVSTGAYALITPGGFRAYTAPKGAFDIVENGRYDVASYEKVNVDVPNNAICGVWNLQALGDIKSGDLLWESHPVNFTTVWNGEVKKCVGIGGTFGESLWYLLEDGSRIGALDLNQWFEDSTGHYAYYVDFGKEPQIISAKLASLLEHCTPAYDHIIEVATGTEMDALLETAVIGSIFKYVGETTDKYENGALYMVEEDVNLISFTIAGTNYQAEEGMTWGAWCESSYNTDGYYATAGETILTKNGELVGNASNVEVWALEEIVKDADYSVKQSTVGGGSN